MKALTGGRRIPIAEQGNEMIKLTKLNGDELILNSDLIETIEERPDTTIQLVNEKYFLVRESADDIVGKVIAYKRQLSKASKPENTKKKK